MREATTTDPLPEAIRLGELVAAGALSVATAESMTGGAVAEALVVVPGSGEWLAGGRVAYGAIDRRVGLSAARTSSRVCRGALPLGRAGGTPRS